MARDKVNCSFCDDGERIERLSDALRGLLLTRKTEWEKQDKLGDWSQAVVEAVDLLGDETLR